MRAFYGEIQKCIFCCVDRLDTNEGFDLKERRSTPWSRGPYNRHYLVNEYNKLNFTHKSYNFEEVSEKHHSLYLSECKHGKTFNSELVH